MNEANQNDTCTTSMTQQLAPGWSESSQEVKRKSIADSHVALAEQQPEQHSGKLAKLNNVEKLKKGLANFVNQLNPAPFFVPAQAHQAPESAAKSPGGQQLKSGSSNNGDLATLVNSDSTVDVLIKGPVRAAQTRSIGGPLRWGRRR